MSKSKTKRSGGFSFSQITGAKTSESMKKMGGVAVGLAAATILNTFLQKKTNLSGGDTILGLDGTTGKYVLPTIIGAVGVIGHQLVKGDFAKDVAIGVAAAGAAGLINKLTEKAIVSLSGDEEMIPGLGAADVTYEQLPVYGGEPQQQYETQPAEYVAENASESEDAEASVAPESGETISGVDDDNFFIA